MQKTSFFKTTEFKLFLTAWIIYIFYLQMYGNSCMANSNSALTASIVKEGRFEVDSYRLASCDLAFYDNHYYSGMAPGISFIAAPLYVIGQAVLSPLPESYVEHLYEKIDIYGKRLPKDFYGKEKRISNYFPTLNKREVLEHIAISSFMLPVFTTAFFSAISVALIYSMLKYFINNRKKRIMIASFYGFGTLLFPVATEFFQRPIAIALGLASFAVLLKIRYKALDIKKSVFAAGLLAGFSVWFDYFHLLLLGLFVVYLIYIIRPESRAIDRFNLIKLKRNELYLLVKFCIGAAIPIILLSGYHYMSFDSPFTTAYKYRTAVDYHVSLSEIEFPSTITIIRLFEFFIYSPIVLFGIYGLAIAIRKKDGHYPEAAVALIFFALTFIYATSLAIFYQSFMPSSHKRYMLPSVPYLMLFISYAFNYSKTKKEKLMKAILIVGLIAIFFNWTSAQFGGHSSLVQFDLTQNKFITGADFVKNGPSSSFIRVLSGVFGLDSFNSMAVNVAALLALIIFIWLIWRRK